MKKEVTIYDIASELNVSPSTVSRALRDHFSIGAITKQRVTRLAAERGYRPAIGRKMYSIGVIVSQVNHPLVSAMISGIEKVASENRFNVIISQSHNNTGSEITLAQSLFDSGVGGLIVLPTNSTSNIDHFMPFSKRNLPVVFLDKKLEGFSANYVVIDYFNAAFTATSHLIDQGCRRIAFMGQLHEGVAFSEKLRGYREALKAKGVHTDEHLIYAGENIDTNDVAGVQQLLSRCPLPDALLADSDMSAVAAIQYVKEKGIRIPQDLAIVGFSDDPVSKIIDPPLSTVALPAVEMGVLAAQEILDQHERRQMYVKTIALKASLVIRQSSLRKPEA